MVDLRPISWLALAITLAGCDSADRLAAGDPPRERRLAAGELHRYRVELPAGHFLRVEVEQLGIDVLLRLVDPEGETVIEVDSPTGDRWTEELLAVSEVAGGHRVEVAALSERAAAGRYRLTVAARSATGDDRRLAEAAASFARGEVQAAAGANDAAEASYRRALELRRAAGDVAGEGHALHRLAGVAARRGDGERAAALYRRARDRFRAAGDPGWEASTLNHLGMFRFSRRHYGAAIDAYRRALAVARGAGDRRLEAHLLHNLGHAHQRRRQAQAAIDAYRRALEVEAELDLGGQLRGDTLHNLGVVYNSVGERRLALAALEAAEHRRAEVGHPGPWAATLERLGQLRLEAGELELADDVFRRTLELRRRAGDRRGEAVTLSSLGRVLELGGRPATAVDRYRRAAEIFRELDDPREEGRALRRLGSARAALGELDAAAGHQRRALELLRRAGEPLDAAELLADLARVERRRGRLEAAVETVAAALRGFEELRTRTAERPDLRASFFATVRSAYELHADLLMELHRRHPGAGYLERALGTSERARARTLVEVIRRSTASKPLDAAGIRRHLGVDGAGVDGAGVDGAGVDGAGVDGAGDAVLFQYLLGEERSFLWTVTAGSVAGFELPPRRRIEALARRAHGLLQGGGRREGRAATAAALCRLSETVLAPAAAELGDRRLLIAADGALHYLPFAALPDPRADGGCAGAPPLVAGHEIVHLPSVSVLAALRQERAGRKPPTGAVAVVADPVFGADDERLASVGGASEGSPAGGPRFERLPASRREAEAILALAPPAASFRALGFDATEELVKSGQLAGYRIVHFATHAVLDDEHPELSGLLLSRFDPAGPERDGFLRLHEIAELELHAELVTVSACRTALGEEVRGEGLIGLTRGFFVAGAERVLVSLWRVSDRSTAELMARFYRHLLAEGAAPPAALRRAQLSMAREERWREPYHWAGFVLQGEWRRNSPHPKTRRRELTAQ